MGYEAKVVLDSVSRGHRLTTMQITFPRIVLAEFNTHRMFSRNSASSRAIPVERKIASIESDPFVPAAFAGNKPGMQAGDALDGATNFRARSLWMTALGENLASAAALAQVGVHKHWANRFLEVGSWHTCVVTATEWGNYDALRDHTAAADEIRTITQMMKAARAASTPAPLGCSAWHLPYVSDPESHNMPAELEAAAARIAKTLAVRPIDVLRRVSVGRCAAVSFERQESTEPDKAVDIYGRLRQAGHMSPFEHPARPMDDDEYDDLFRQRKLEWLGTEKRWFWVGMGLGNGQDPTTPEGDYTHFCGNFQGWIQDRKMIPGEDDFSRVGAAT